MKTIYVLTYQWGEQKHFFNATEAAHAFLEASGDAALWANGPWSRDVESDEPDARCRQLITPDPPKTVAAVVAILEKGGIAQVNKGKTSVDAVVVQGDAVILAQEYLLRFLEDYNSFGIPAPALLTSLLS